VTLDEGQQTASVAANRASLQGEIINDLPDRISDVVIFIGAAHSGWMHPIIGYRAAILALLTGNVSRGARLMSTGNR